jgi:hypothetical protein
MCDILLLDIVKVDIRALNIPAFNIVSLHQYGSYCSSREFDKYLKDIGHCILSFIF